MEKTGPGKKGHPLTGASLGVDFSYISLYENLANRLLENEIVGSARRVTSLAGQKDGGSGIENLNMVNRNERIMVKLWVRTFSFLNERHLTHQRAKREAKGIIFSSLSNML